jgi:hypothetical protein
MFLEEASFEVEVGAGGDSAESQREHDATACGQPPGDDDDHGNHPMTLGLLQLPQGRSHGRRTAGELRASAISL